jgi:hypothetical protein
MVAENVFSTVIAASLISILLNVFIVRGALRWLGRRLPAGEDATGKLATVRPGDSSLVPVQGS